MELNIESLTKHYGDLCALEDFTVCLRPGVYGLLGPNGAGKSTLMNLLTDTVKREAGSIRYNGKEILELGRGYRALVGYMPQQQGYYEEFTVGRFLLYYMAALKGLSRSKARGEITEFLEVVGLSDCLHKKMGSLSGGMRQRILLVQALLGSPKVLLLDEPTAGLDPEERIRIRNYISAIATERIVLLATHVVSDVESIARGNSSPSQRAAHRPGRPGSSGGPNQTLRLRAPLPAGGAAPSPKSVPHFQHLPVRQPASPASGRPPTSRPPASRTSGWGWMRCTYIL